MTTPLRVGVRLRVAIITLAVAASSCATKKETASTVTLKTTTTPGGTTAATATVGPAKKEGIKKFSDLIGKVKADSGLVPNV
jgi:ABC-type metal ion transport system substrate-binding protein